MQTNCCLCGYCREVNRNHDGLDVQDGQWLEELGEMIAATVEAMTKAPASSAGCYGRRAAA